MTVPDATPEALALEPLIRAAMAAGAMCAAERARDGLIDPCAPLGDAFGDFPAEFLSIRRFTVDDALARIRAEALREAIHHVRWVYDLQCPVRPAKDYVSPGARIAHLWWQQVLGDVLEDLTARADRIEAGEQP